MLSVTYRFLNYNSHFIHNDSWNYATEYINILKGNFTLYINVKVAGSMTWVNNSSVEGYGPMIASVEGMPIQLQNSRKAKTVHSCMA